MKSENNMGGSDISAIKPKEASDTTNISGFTNPSMIKYAGNSIELENQNVNIKLFRNLRRKKAN